MTAAQTRIADTLETFYGASDRTSEGAMAGHAYKRSVDDLDGGFGRELVRTWFARNVRDGADLIVRTGRIARPSRSR